MSRRDKTNVLKALAWFAGICVVALVLPGLLTAMSLSDLVIGK
jgi:hypothetical protein